MPNISMNKDAREKIEFRFRERLKSAEELKANENFTPCPINRMEKARNMGISHILAYKLNVKQHIDFLTDRTAYLSYVEYWNGKLK